MSERSCPQEHAVVEAARTGRWTQSLEAHVNACRECADSVSVTAWLDDAAARLGRDAPAPDPTYIWLRAEIARRAARQRGPSWRRLAAATVPGLAVAVVSTALVVAVLPAMTAAGAAAWMWLAGTFAEASVIEMAVIAAGWLGLPLMLTAAYLLALRPLR